MVKPEEFAPRLRREDWRGWGVVAVDLCAAGSVYPPLHGHMRIRVLLGPSLLHSGVSPTRLCLPTRGAQSQTPGEGSTSSSRGVLPLGKQPLLAFVINVPVYVSVPLPRSSQKA